MANPQLRQVALTDITVAPQVREQFDETDLSHLAQSMAEVGLVQPIRLRREAGVLVVVDGERRLRAARLLEWDTIAAVIDDEPLTPSAVMQRQLIANCQHRDLLPTEKAKAIDRLMQETGWPAAAVADKLGLSEATVSKLRRLLELPDELQAAIDKGDLAASAAYEIAKTRDAKERGELVGAALSGTLTRASAAKRSKGARKRERPKAARRRTERIPDVVIALGGGRSVTVTGPSLTTSALTAWLEELLERFRLLATPAMELDAAVEAVSAGKES